MALPIPVAVLIPAAIIFAFRASRWVHAFSTPSRLTFWLGVAAVVSGFASALWSVLAFARRGEGTPAPWDPPTRFVAYGPYRFVRNPMILGVFLLLLGEAVLLRSIPLIVWFAVFVIGNSLYIPLIEEKGLERRFGTPYAQYKKNVPRWFPRWTAWHSVDEAKQGK
jgi:protein-S-isoprenylcysteine O-methyltransferase Ste14